TWSGPCPGGATGTAPSSGGGPCCPARCSTGLDDLAGEADQDRGEGGLAFQDPDVSAGRGGRAPVVVRGDPGPDRAAASGAEPGMTDGRGRMVVAWSRGGRGWSALR